MKTDFLISPAYAVLPMRQSRWSKLSTMNVFVAVPSICGMPLKPGQQMTVNSGTWRRYSSFVVGMMNMFRANRLCQACSVTMRTGMR